MYSSPASYYHIFYTLGCIKNVEDKFRGKKYFNMFEIQISYVLSKMAVQTKFLLIIQSPTITTAVTHIFSTVTA